MGTRNSFQKDFTYQKIVYAFKPPYMHEKMYKNSIVHKKNIQNKIKMDNFTIFSPKLLKASAIGLGYRQGRIQDFCQEGANFDENIFSNFINCGIGSAE